MSATPNSANTLFGRGQVFFDRFDANGVSYGQYVSLGNCDQFAISIVADEVDMTDYTQSTSLPYNRAIKKTTADIKISGFEVSTKNMAILVLGDITTYTQTAHTAAGQTETLVPAGLTNVLGSFFKAPFRSVTAPTLVQGTNTLVSGTDYEIFDASSGTFHILPAGVTVVDSTAITYNYTAAALSGATAKDVVRAGNTALLKGSLLFLPNVATGPQIEVRIYNVSLAPDGDIGLISDDFLKWNMKGSINSDASGTYGGSSVEPFFRTITR
jgi:hypothetical protein